MVEESKPGQMELDTRENIFKVRSMDKDTLSGLMDQLTKGNFWIITFMG
jgi:hypothetical protein